MKNRPKPARLTFTAIALAGLVAAGCDDLSRFKQERYECNFNQHGLVEIDIRDMEVGTEVAVSFTDGDRKMLLTESSDSNFTLTNEQLILRVDRKSGTVRLTRGSRYLNISCSKSEFRM
jgi:hypothetical protein